MTLHEKLSSSKSYITANLAQWVILQSTQLTLSCATSNFGDCLTQGNRACQHMHALSTLSVTQQQCHLCCRRCLQRLLNTFAQSNSNCQQRTCGHPVMLINGSSSQANTQQSNRTSAQNSSSQLTKPSRRQDQRQLHHHITHHQNTGPNAIAGAGMTLPTSAARSRQTSRQLRRLLSWPGKPRRPGS